MNLDQVKQFALAVGTRVESASGEWAQCKCPLSPWTHDSGKDSHPSFAFTYGDNIETRFNCFTCESGDLHRLISLLERYGAKAPKYDLTTAMKMWIDEESGDSQMVFTEESEDNFTPEDVVFPESWLSTFIPAVNAPLAMEYLNARRVSKKTASALDIRWDTQRRCVAFPIRNWEGELVGLRGRYTESGSGARYHDYGYRNIRNKLPWYGEHTVDTSRPVLMVESVFDYASVYRVYKNILAPLTVGLSRGKCARVRNVFEIYTLFDTGRGGDKGRDKLSENLQDTGSIITHLSCPDHRDDPGDMRKKELRKVLEKHIVLDAQ